MSAATPQEGILILLKISIALRFEPYRRSGKLGKRFERVNLLQARGQWKEGDRGLGLRKTKPEA